MQFLKSTIAFLIGIVPGIIYYQTEMVGVAGTLFLMVVGGFIGLALSWPGVSTRRVLHETAKVAPIVWPLAALVGKPEPEEEIIPAAPDIPDPEPVSQIDPKWLTKDVVAIARAIRADSKHELLPVLGDALVEAGCEDDSLLGLCFAGQWNDETRQFLDELLD